MNKSDSLKLKKPFMESEGQGRSSNQSKLKPIFEFEEVRTPEDQSPSRDNRSKNLSSVKKVFNYQEVIDKRHLPLIQHQKSEVHTTIGLQA